MMRKAPGRAVFRVFVLVGLVAVPGWACVSGARDPAAVSADDATPAGDGGQGGQANGEEPAAAGGAAGVPAAPDTAGAGGAGGEGGQSSEPTAGQGGGGSAGTPMAGGSSGFVDPGRPSDAHVPMFVAFGDGGRSVTSCDDGKSWTHHEPGNGQGGDHSPWRLQGAAYGKGAFVAVYGWGAAGSIRTSEDGIMWRTISPGAGGGFGGIGFAGDRFVAFGGHYQGADLFTSPDGRDWSRGGSLRFGTHTRYVAGALVGETWTLVVAGYDAIGAVDNTRKFAVSTNRGASFRSLDAPNCVRSVQHGAGVAIGGGLVVSVGQDGNTCHSKDGGQTFVAGRNVGAGIGGNVIFTGQDFMAFNGARGYRSADGIAWQAVAFPAGVDVDVAAVSPAGTFVGVSNGGNGFFRSEDGRVFTRVTGPAGSSLRRLLFGYGRKSDRCP